MKCVLEFLLSLIKPTPKPQDSADDYLWKHLDGAEFSVIYPKPGTTAIAE